MKKAYKVLAVREEGKDFDKQQRCVPRSEYTVGLKYLKDIFEKGINNDDDNNNSSNNCCQCVKPFTWFPSAHPHVNTMKTPRASVFTFVKWV